MKYFFGSLIVWHSQAMQRNHIHIVKTGGTIEFLDLAYEDMNKVLA